MLATLLGISGNSFAQDPALPPTNLGLANVFDGIAGKPGFVYQAYVQVFQTRGIYDAHGDKVHNTLKVNSLATLHQLIYLSNIRVFSGNLGFTAILPLAQVSASNTGGAAPSTNPGVLGDPILGTAVQWSDKKIFGKAFSHRTEVDISLPLGAYNTTYAINPSAHLYSFGIYHTFTLLLDPKFSISSRNQFNYNTHIIGTKAQPGTFYNGNFSADYSILPSLKMELVGYLLAQIKQDRFDRRGDYYAVQYGIADTRERVLGFGPGLVYFLSAGGLIEAKVFFETAAMNRAAGFRPTLRVALPVSK